MKRVYYSLLFFFSLVSLFHGAVEKIHYHNVEQLITAYNRWVEMRRYNYETSDRYSLQGKIARLQCIYYDALNNDEISFIDATNQIAISLKLNTEKYQQYSSANRNIIQNWILKGLRPTRYVSFEIDGMYNRELIGHLIRIH